MVKCFSCDEQCLLTLEQCFFNLEHVFSTMSMFFYCWTMFFWSQTMFFIPEQCIFLIIHCFELIIYCFFVFKPCLFLLYLDFSDCKMFLCCCTMFLADYMRLFPESTVYFMFVHVMTYQIIQIVLRKFGVVNQDSLAKLMKLNCNYD